jgi:hypothetical protein
MIDRARAPSFQLNAPSVPPAGIMPVGLQPNGGLG